MEYIGTGEESETEKKEGKKEGKVLLIVSQEVNSWKKERAST